MARVRALFLDLETYSDVDLSKCGVYKYAESDAFEILLFGYSVDGGEVKVVDIAQGEEVPEEVLNALTDSAVIKWAHNCAFERVCLSAWLKKNYPEKFCSYSIEDDTVGNYLDPEGWRCSMVWCAYMGLPLSLEKAGEVLGLTSQKMAEGKSLIRYFCIPCKPTKANGMRTRNLPEHDLEKWETFKVYNKRDVEVEIGIMNRLSSYPVPDFLWEEYWLDQEINDRGICLDMDVVRNAIRLDDAVREELLGKMQSLTGLENPNSVMQLRGWLLDKGIETESLGKKQIEEMLQNAPDDVSEVLRLRQMTAKSSVKKYQAMENAACRDDRARGMFLFLGATRTGRFAGRLIQLQNLYRNSMPDLSQARGLVKGGNTDALFMLYDNIPDMLAQLVRTAFVPKPGFKFIVSDFSAIEARVLSWLAGESWRMDAFERGDDIYCASASQMFGVPVEKHGVNGDLRQKGKQAELACGYGGSVGALKAMGALEMGLTEDELQPLVDAWRTANLAIVQYWYDVDRAVKKAIKKKTETSVGDITFSCRSGMLFITLPSRRTLSYVKPRIGENRFGGESVTYEGVGSTKKWERLESYGAKFVENIVQAISRDILMNAMKTLRHCFIVGHVHDELIIECSKDVSVDAVCEQMARTPSWAEGLLLNADGYECEFYMKD